MKKNLLKNALLSFAVLFSVVGVSAFSSTSLASEADVFKAFEGVYKGPFGKNMLQGTRSRIVVTAGLPSGTTLFQAAYRNDFGKDLADNYNFYVANLFTTNYYELMGEYVFGDRDSDHELDHVGLNANASLAMPKASSMVRHWVLEKFYLTQFPNSRLARSYLLRGISDVQNESEYATYFFNFFISNLTDDFQFLTASLLAQKSPLNSNAAIERARNLVAAGYDSLSASYGADNQMVRRYYEIRNAVHNQLSPETVKLIDAFIRNYGSYNSLQEVKSILEDYYSFSASKIVNQAKKLGFAPVELASGLLPSRGSAEVSALLNLSEAGAQLRTAITDEGQIPYDKKTEALILLGLLTQYLNAQISAVSTVNSTDILIAALNSVYMEGFLIQDNWEFFRSEMLTMTSASQAASLMTDVVFIGTGTLEDAFSPALAQWKTIESEMEYFVDNTVKSSALNAAALAVSRVQ